MPKASVTANPSSLPSTGPAPHPAPHTLSSEEKLDLIVMYLHRMDRRDRIRTIGGTIRSLIAIIPLILFLVSAWYLYTNSAQILQSISEASAKAVLKMNPASDSDLMKRFEEYFK